MHGKEEEFHTESWWKTWRKADHLECLIVNLRLILNCVLKTRNEKLWNGIIQTKQRQMEGSCKSSNKIFRLYQMSIISLKAQLMLSREEGPLDLESQQQLSRCDALILCVSVLSSSLGWLRAQWEKLDMLFKYPAVIFMYVPWIFYTVIDFINNTQHICIFNNIYIVITPTCFATCVSSSGSSKVVLR
jgi:hypothetical protein